MNKVIINNHEFFLYKFVHEKVLFRTVFGDPDKFITKFWKFYNKIIANSSDYITYCVWRCEKCNERISIDIGENIDKFVSTDCNENIIKEII
jgi:hypothetical protein